MTTNDYIDYYQTILDSVEGQRTELVSYLKQQTQQLKYLMQMVSEETFWQVFPKILGIDARLSILIELIPYEEFSDTEIIRIIETDYKVYFKELCGYTKASKPVPSLLFQME